MHIRCRRLGAFVMQAKDYARGDEVRDELAAAGIMIMDTPTGTTWRPGLRAQAASEASEAVSV